MGEMAHLYPRSKASRTACGIASKMAKTLEPDTRRLPPDCACSVSVCPSQEIFQLRETLLRPRSARCKNPRSAASAWD